MAKKRPTPEEQLLDLIEEGGAAGTVKFKRKRKLSLKFFSLKSWLSWREVTGQGLARLKSGLREPNLKVLNKVFLIISIILLGYSITHFVFSRLDIEEVYRKSRLVKKRVPEQKLVAEVRPFLHYLEMVRRRNIFSPVVFKEPEKPEVKKKQLEKMTQGLNLVGISWDKEPVAMVEDKAAEKTYFLKKGDWFNEFKIDDILRDRVILSFEGKTIELF